MRAAEDHGSFPAAAESYAFAAQGRWWELARLRAFVGPRAVLLGYDCGPAADHVEYAFLAAGVSRPGGNPARRMTALIRLADHTAAVVFDLGVAEDPAPLPNGILVAHAPLARALGDAVSLRVLQTAAGAIGWQPLSSAELAGVRLAGRVVMFHVEPSSARSAVSFAAEGAPALKCLVGGLAPGMWEIWRNGWLEEPMAGVAPRSGALYFESRAGSYFLRRR